MSTEDWKLQVSYKTSTGDMINIRAHTADELSVLLENIGDYATQIAATQRQLAQANTISPLSTSNTTASTEPPHSFSPTPPNTPTATAPTQGSPMCQHGPRKYKSGISSKTGKPYAMWVCPMPQGADQCKPVN
jgi:hypothetical protein